MSTFALKTDQNIQSNKVGQPKTHKKSGGTQNLANNTKNNDPNALKTDKTLTPEEVTSPDFSNYFNWEGIKDTVHTQKEPILYCS